GDLYRALEHVDKRFFGDMLSFIHNLMIQIGPDDAQTYLDKTKDEALSALKVQNTDKKSKKSDNENDTVKDEAKTDSSKNINSQVKQNTKEGTDTLAKSQKEESKKESKKTDDPVRI
ncbi:MAG: hypothetical protein II291_03530, partial [Succinivibrio sp.]|nr:hypothetical protein [Succinivibrio sp.]